MELETSEELVRWMEAEGLSPMTLLDIRLPRGAADAPSGRSRAPKTVKPIKMVWGVQDLESEGERERFLAWPVVAEGVTVLRTEGELDPYEECHVTVLEGSGVAFRLEAGGVVDLHCTRCVIGTPTARARKAKPRPHHGELHLELDVTSITMQQVRSWLGIPTEMPLVDRRGSVASDDVGVLGGRRLTFGPAPERSWLWVASDSASRLSLSRGKWSSDEFWSAVWRRARLVPGVKSISSRDLVTEPAAWPAEPPPKPAPDVWPDVFVVVCDYRAMGVPEFASVVGLSPGVTLALAHDAHTIEQAVARTPAGSPYGRIVRADGTSIVECSAHGRESALSFRRERACDDVTWNAVWSGSGRLPGYVQRHSRTTTSPPDPWPDLPPSTRGRSGAR